MRKIIVLSFISLDGVMQAPGGPEEDKSGGFKFGGWSAPFADKVTGGLMQKQMAPTDILLGRKTFKIFASYWPEHASFWPGINDVTKYVLSRTLRKTDKLVTGWKNSIIIKSLADIKKLKSSKGADIKVWGSSELAQLLLKNDLVDELWLKTYPVILGKGKKLFDNNAFPTSLTLTESTVTPSGVIFANYKRAGKVKTGSFTDSDSSFH
jgi:dihydrofolate reductase